MFLLTKRQREKAEAIEADYNAGLITVRKELAAFIMQTHRDPRWEGKYRIIGFEFTDGLRVAAP